VQEVLGIELDRHLCENLQKDLKFANLRLTCQDILRFDFRKLPSKVKVIGNLPYYISTPIISHLLENKNKITSIFIALQKELGERVLAIPGGKEYGAFTCFVQYHTQPRILLNLKKGCFRPQPKVDSVFLELKIRERPAVVVEDEAWFFKIIRRAFNQRRKTISNALSGLFPKPALKDILEKARINPQSRPEQLSLEDFARLSNLTSG
jgi:16S rRNA (adenine1518-N6/adenine1519-N6)-dimethyltransferase